MMTKKTLTHSLIIWSIATLFYIFEYCIQMSPSVMSIDLMQDFGVNAQSLGTLAACFFMAYCIMQIPSGLLMDYFGPRRVLVVATLCCAMGTYLFGQADSLIQAQIARICMGLGGAFAALGCLKLTTSWFPANYFPWMSGLVLSCGMLGAICGQAPLAYLVDAWGWRTTLVNGAYFGVLLALLIACAVKDKPSNSQHNQEGFLLGLWCVLKNPQNWLLAMFAGLIFSPISGFCGLWGVPFFMAKYGVSASEAGWLVSMVFVGVAIGSPLWGIIANHLGRRKPTILVSTILNLILLICIIYLPISLSIVWYLLGLFGASLSGFFGSFAMIREQNPNQYAATALGFINMVNMIGGALAQPIIGLILDKRWDGQWLNGVRLFQVTDYQMGFLLLIFNLIFGLVLLLWIKETYCQSNHAIQQNEIVDWIETSMAQTGTQ